MALLCALGYDPVLAATTDTDGGAPIHRVLLQGSSTPELAQLVRSSGGKLTHELHIIDAVGAELTDPQLEQVTESPLVTRHIDDLALSTPPVAEGDNEAPSCRVGGNLELAFTGRGISWTLHNLLEDPARLASLKLTWPQSLGQVRKVVLAGREIDPASDRDAAPYALELNLEPGTGPLLKEEGILLVEFASLPEETAAGIKLLQSDFTATAAFEGGCSTSLVPGYPDNHENYHYAEVVGAAELHRNGITGRGVTVAVLDSGLWEAPPLARDTRGKPRVVARYNAITNREEREVVDESGHGTHLSSVIAHSGKVTREGADTGSFQGIAPDANLVVVKAFDINGHGDFLDITRGVQWVVDNREKYGIRILNLSFAAFPRWPYWLDPINQAVMRAWASGITVVAAAGNEGPDPMTVGSPGNLPYVITVGAVTDSWTPDDRDDDYIPDFSSRGPTPSAHLKPDLVAPGGHITGITRPGSTLEKEHPNFLLNTGEFVMTGSSQASAIVSGITALLLQLEPDLTPDDVKCKLISSAEPAINADGLLAYSPLQQGYGYASASRAVTLGNRGCGNTGLNIGADIAGKEHFEGPAVLGENGEPDLPGLSRMLSAQPPAEGMSHTRKWGVKDHIERLPTHASQTADTPPSFDWLQLYLDEKAAIERLQSEPPN